ncbi:MAG TPA: hypothetical protein VGN07_19450 [Steroidobacteraceae bacterium]|jgi:hypothetical protein
MNDMLSSVEFFHPSSSIHLPLPEASRALEQAWQRRRQELAGWQPSGGWLIERNAIRHSGRQ